MIPYDEAKSVEFGQGINQANADYKAIHGTDIPYDPGMSSVMSSRAAWDYYVGGLDWGASLLKHLKEYRDVYGIPPPPFEPAPRYWRGNMCGVRVPGLQPVPGGASDSSLVLSWFYDRYGEADRAKIRAAWAQRSLSHVLVSWPDSQNYGYSPQQFLATCLELKAHGFYPCVFLCAKPTSSADVRDLEGTWANIELVLPSLVGHVPMFCVGWELSLWLTPSDVQTLIDRITSQTLTQPGTLNYVHFQEGYGSFQQNGHTVADFWNANIGKLTGLLHQKLLNQNENEYRYGSGGIDDMLQRFAGGFNCSPESGFGHPFDFVACEITAMTQFNGSTSEDAGNHMGEVAIDTPPRYTHAGTPVGVMGSGNGL